MPLKNTADGGKIIILLVFLSLYFIGCSCERKKDINTIIIDLNNQNPQVRIDAVHALRFIYDERVADLLNTALNDKDDLVKCIATRMAGVIQDSRTVETLINLLNDKDRNVRSNAIEALGKIRDTRVTKALLTILQNDKDRGWFVAAALGNSKDASAVEPLITILKNKEHPNREAATVALGMIGDSRAVAPLIDALGEENNDKYFRAGIASALIKMKDKRAIEPLMSFLGRYEMALELARLDDSRVFEPVVDPFTEAIKEKLKGTDVDNLISSLNDKNYDDLRHTIIALGKIRNKSAFKPLMAIINKKVMVGPYYVAGSGEVPEHEVEVGRFVVWALGDLGDERAVEPLIGMLKSDDHSNYAIAADALGNLKDPRAVEPLIAVLKKDKEWHVQFSVATALAKIGNKEAIEDLIDIALNNRFIAVRVYAAELLGKIKNARIIDFLLDSFKNKNWAVIFANGEFFIRRGESGTEEVLITALKKEYGMNKWQAENMAMAMYKCGNSKLSEAGRIWMENEGIRYETKKDYVGPKWGQGN